jgi:serine/threonine protein phosphatase PrpC
MVVTIARINPSIVVCPPVLELGQPVDDFVSPFSQVRSQKAFGGGRRYEDSFLLDRNGAPGAGNIDTSPDLPMSAVLIPEAVAIDIAGLCNRGKIREENLDTVRHTSTRLGDLLVVAEGIGGGGFGAKASQMAVDTISASVEGMPAFFPPEIAVEEAICHANAAIAAAAAELDSPYGRMGATVVVALLRTDPDHGHSSVQAIIGHVGNSHAYLVHDQNLTLLTPDQSAVQDRLGNEQMGLEKAETLPHESMPTRYLGQELNVRLERREGWLEPGDALLLCSYGLWGYATGQEIERILSDRSRGVEEASRALLKLALDKGGYDNVAFEIARLPQSNESAVTAPSAEPMIEIRSRATAESIPERTSSTSANSSTLDMPQSEDAPQSVWPDAPLAMDRGGFEAEYQAPKRSKVFSLIRDLGRRIVERDTVAEKPANGEADAPSASEDLRTLSWVAPASIVYGTRLSSMQLNATASVQGKFAYTPGLGYRLPAGNHTLWVTFHPAHSPEENQVLASVPITVSKAAPSIHWPKPSVVPPGVALTAAQLNASASVPGIFEYSPSAGDVLPDGMHTLSVTFIPADAANYITAQATVSVTVAKTVPEIEWAPPEPISYGTPLGIAELRASASIPGTFAYSPTAGELLPAGLHTLSVTFTPSDGISYTPAMASVPLTVIRGTPALSWPMPERITYGTILNEAQLNATASVPGTFVYYPAPGAMLAAGEHNLSVAFTPSNLSDYAPTQAVRPLSVGKARPAVSWTTPQPINSVTPLGPAQLNASASVPGTLAYTPASGVTLGPGDHSLSVAFTPVDTLNYTAARAGVSLKVTEIARPVVTWRCPSSIPYGAALGEEHLCASSSVPGSFFYIPTAGNVLPPGKHKLSLIFTPEDQEKYLKVQAAVTLIVEETPNTVSHEKVSSQTPLTSEFTAQPVAAPAAEGRTDVRKDDQTPGKLQRKTRVYRGALYEKGDDNQWHLHRK